MMRLMIRARRGRSKSGSLVKRLRHRPLTPVTRVRFPHESPIALQKFKSIAKDGKVPFEVGVDDVEGPPVPIPNTEVKLNSAENTWRATAREDRKMPTQIFLHSSVGRAHDC